MVGELFVEELTAGCWVKAAGVGVGVRVCVGGRYICDGRLSGDVLGSIRITSQLVM